MAANLIAVKIVNVVKHVGNAAAIASMAGATSLLKCALNEERVMMKPNRAAVYQRHNLCAIEAQTLTLTAICAITRANMELARGADFSANNWQAVVRHAMVVMMMMLCVHKVELATVKT